MNIYHAVPGEPIPLGRRREHLARRIVFDISAWVRDFGAGTVQLLHQRQGDAAPYPVTITRTAADGETVDDATGTLVLWDVTNVDTYYLCHFGKAELRYYRGTQAAPEFLAKSEIYQTSVLDALGAALPAAPEEHADWFDILLDALGIDAPEIDLSDYALKSELPTVPTNVSAFTNDAGYLTGESLEGIATSDLSFRASADVTLSDGASFVSAVGASFGAEAGTVVGVQAQIPLVVESAATGDAASGWTSLSDATVTAQYLCDNVVLPAAPTWTLDSGNHVLTFLHYFTVQSGGTHSFSLQLRIAGGEARTVASNITLGLSGVKEA